MVSVIGILVLGGLLALIVYAITQVQKRGSGAADGGGVRRFFQYVLLYGLMIVSAVGVAGLLTRLFGGEADGPAALARALTFTVIGLPLFIGLAAWSRRRLAEDPGETRSFGWTFYATIAPLTALIAAMVGLNGVAAWAFGADDFEASALAGLLAWGGMWLLHWLATVRLADSRRFQAHHVLGSAIGLGTGAWGLAWLLSTTIELLIGSRPGFAVGSSHDLGRAAALLVTGGVVWVVYWLRTLSRADRTPLWFVHVLPIGVGGGLVTAISALSTLLYTVLVWFVGRPFVDDASRHFSGAPGAVAAALVGVLVWWYHRTVLAENEPAGRTEVRRVYEYLMAGVALLAAAGGLTTVLVAVIEALTGSGGIDVGRSAVNTLLAAVTLLAVGGPVWWFFWRRLQAARASDPEGELASPTRRVYLFILFGLIGLVAVVTLLVGVFILIEDMLDGRLSAETIRSMRYALGLLVTSGAIAWYHWSVYRDDREAAPVDTRRFPRFVLLIGGADPDFEREVGRVTGARVELWPRTDGGAGTWVLDDVVEALSGSEHREVTVVSGVDGLQVIGVDRD